MFVAKRLAMLALVAGLLILTPGVGADGNEGKTGLFLNGRGWKALPETAKLFYSMGISNTSQYLSVALNDPVIDLLGRTHLPHNESVAALDIFYAEPENVWIPVFDAHGIIRMKVDGKSAEQIDQALAAARRNAQELRQTFGKPAQ